MSAVYPLIRQQLISWALNANAPAGLAFYALGVDASYVYSAAHNDLADIAGASIVADLHLLDSVTYVNGILDAADEEWTDLVLTETFDAVIVLLRATDLSSFLVCYIDSSTDGSVPQTVGSTSGLVRWNVAGICKI